MKKNQFVVVKGFLSPKDDKKKAHRRAVVLEISLDEEWALVAPATSYYDRNGVVPRGAVLLSRKSAAYAGTGFDVDNTSISLRDASWYPVKSIWMENVHPIGVLDLNKDLRLKDMFMQVRKEVKLDSAPVFISNFE